MAAIPPKPSLTKSTALAKTQATLVRLQTLLPTTVTELSPVTVYEPSASVSGLLFAPTELLPNIAGFYGVWTAPDLNNGAPYQIQVECFGPGGGAGGGIATAGGGGGGGGEYACEPTLTVSPNINYAYCVGVSGTGGCNNSSAEAAQQGTSGSQTVFDLAGLAIPGGVIANPGQPGDIGSTGIGGPGGTGSTNSIHADGGAGGTNQSGLGSDNPLTLAQTSAFFVGNTLSTSIVKAWYIFNDGPDNTFEFNDSSTLHNTATVTTSSTGIHILQGNAPAQVPAYSTAANPPHAPNATTAGCSSLWNGANNSQYAGYAQAPIFTFAGTKLTISCWLQCDPTGTWGNNAANGVGTVAANSKNYYTFGNFGGYGLFFLNTGTSANPNWFLYFNVGNASAANFVRVAMTPVVGTWYYVVATFNSGTIKLYVNGTSVGTAAAGFTSLPGAAYNTRIGANPAATTQYYFGYMSNIWFADDCAQPALVTQAFGTTSPTGGAGGGASGGPGGTGGAGATATAGTGGAGGTAAAVPASLSSIRTAGNNGMVGWNAGQGFAGSPSNGAGGGGGGDMPSNPASTTLVIPFTTAATYNGIDAAFPGAPYSSNQQTASGGLFTGGVSGDSASGSKNTMMLMPSGLAKTLGNNAWSIQQIFITFTNANPTNAVDTILEFAYSNDTVLPQSYTGVSATEYVGNALIPAGSNTVTYDLTNSDLAAHILAGTATALIFGPTDNPTFDAYSATTGAQFYNEIYGVGATDNSGNSLQPFLTVVLQKTLTTQIGGGGGVGAISLTQITDTGQPVAFAQPFAGTDGQGNTYGAGFTGAINNWNPALASPSILETWHTVGNGSTGAGSTLGTGWTVQAGQPLQFTLGADGFVKLNGALNIASGSGTGTQTLCTLPSAWRPNRSCFMRVAVFPFSATAVNPGAGNFAMTFFATINTSGVVTLIMPGTDTIITVLFDTGFPLVSNTV